MLLKQSLISMFLISACFAQAPLCESDTISSKCVCGYNQKNSKTHYMVDCARTGLDTIPDITRFPPHFDEFDVSHNNLVKLEVQGNFQSSTLKVLKASFNNISVVTPEFLQKIPNLKRLELGHNNIVKLDWNTFIGVPDLHHLDISFNSLQSLPDKIFKPLHSLNNVDMSYNNLGQQLTKIKYLFYSNLGLNTNLTVLKLNYANITDLPGTFFENSSLLHIDLADNFINEIPKLPYSVEILDLSGNYFKELHMHHLHYSNLKKLKLSRLTLLDKVAKYAFYNMQKLEVLVIEHCPKLTEFSDAAFGYLTPDESFSLKKVSLMGNGLTALNQSLFYLFNKLEEVDLGNNPWNCDCDVLWYSLIKDKFRNKNTMRCTTPPKLVNQDVLQLTDKQLPKCVPGSGWRTHKILVSIISVLVVMLVCIIIYLIYLGPFRVTVKKFVGTESPYSTIVVRDEN